MFIKIRFTTEMKLYFRILRKGKSRGNVGIVLFFVKVAGAGNIFIPVVIGQAQLFYAFSLAISRICAGVSSGSLEQSDNSE